MLKFLGLGSAFNTKLGNTSAYIKENDSLWLIDCGGTVFHQIKELDLLKNIKKLHIMITHTHSDHIGSLSDLIFYAHYILHIKPTLYYPEKKLIKTYLSCVGVEKQMVNIINQKNISFDDNSKTITFIPVSHLPTVKSYGLILEEKSKTIYYSGDANSIPKEILMNIDRFDYLYQDTCGLDYDGNAHLSLKRLTQCIPSDMREKVFCIHLDEHIDRSEIKQLGFQLPTITNK